MPSKKLIKIDDTCLFYSLTPKLLTTDPSSLTLSNQCLQSSNLWCRSPWLNILLIEFGQFGLKHKYDSFDNLFVNNGVESKEISGTKPLLNLLSAIDSLFC